MDRRDASAQVVSGRAQPPGLRRVAMAVGPIARRVTPRPVRHWIRRRLGITDLWNANADYRPRQWPAGFVVGLPDFVGVGAQRSGSTWWWKMIHQHPDVYHYGNLNKERRFLVRFYNREPDDADIADYAAWFPHPPGLVVGEWSPIYLAYPWIGSLLERFVPRAKILVILRDPIERYRSGLALQGDDLDEARALRQAGLGYYAAQLLALEASVERSNLLVLQYERCREDPQTQLARTFEFLGLPAFPVDVDVMRRPVGAVFDVKPELSAARRRILVDAYGPDVDALVASHPEVDRSLWPNFR